MNNISRLRTPQSVLSSHDVESLKRMKPRIKGNNKQLIKMIEENCIKFTKNGKFNLVKSDGRPQKANSKIQSILTKLIIKDRKKVKLPEINESGTQTQKN